MGQRLNLEIVDNNCVLANAYYHWSAYSGSAIALTETALNAFYDVPDDLSVRGHAVFMLQETGAGVYQEEFARINKNESLLDIGVDYRNAIDRNRGLLSVTNVGIVETERWEECRVTINIEDCSIDFDVLWSCSRDEYEDDCEICAYDDLPEHDVFFNNIPFDEFFRIREAFELYSSGFKTTDGTAVIWIQ